MSAHTSRSVAHARWWLVALALVIPAPKAQAWGDEGHEIVALIADHYLTPAARARLQQLLAEDHSGLVVADTIALEATWADRYRDSDRYGTQQHYRGTRAWHFVDLELKQPDLSSACFGEPPLPSAEPASMGPASDCVVDKIQQFLRELSSADTSDAERVLALQFLLHFVGDAHQPLHASDDHDQGGNTKSVTASGLPASNLHHYWDTEFVQQLGPDPALVARALWLHVSASDRAAWRRGQAADWARESFRVARASAYGPLPAAASDGHYALTPVYVRQAVKSVSLQLRRAGVRLAWLLNQALGT